MSKPAKIISILGHPLLIGILYVIFISFQKLDSADALLVSGLIISIVVIPVIIHNLYRIKTGTYTNFDVSDQKQRRGFYPFAIGLFSLVLLSFYFLNIRQEVIYNTSLFLLLLLLMALLNLKTKASLHAAIAFYISVNLFDFGLIPGLIMLFFAVIISWSRWLMKRHSLIELVVGSIIGIIFGWISLSIVL